MNALILSFALSTVSSPPDIRATGMQAAKTWCYRQTTEYGRPCQVKDVYFSAKDDILVLGAAVFVDLMSSPLVVTMRYKYGAWYIDDVLVKY